MWGALVDFGFMPAERASGGRSFALGAALLLSTALFWLVPSPATAAAPANDDFAAAEELSGALPLTDSGTTAEATKETGEPNHAGDAGGTSVWYSWTPAADVTVNIESASCGGPFPSGLLGVYTGSAVDALTSVGSASFACPNRVQLDASASQTYYVALDNGGPFAASGAYDITIRELTPPANDDLANAAEVGPGLPINEAGTNVDATKETGEPNHAAAPGGGGASVWYSWEPNVSRTVLLSGTCGLAAVYTGAGYGSLTEIASTLSCSGGGVRFDVLAGTEYLIAVDDDRGTGAPFNLKLRDATPPANDDFAAAAVVSGSLPITESGTTLDATRQTGEPDHGGGTGPEGKSVWYSWTPVADGQASISVDSCVAGGAGFGNLLRAYTGEALEALTPAGNSSTSGCGSSATVEVSAGTEYLIAVENRFPTVGDGTENFELTIEELDPPANDDFGSAEELTGPLPISRPTTNVDATKQPGEPDHAGNPGGASVWYSWTPTSDRSVLVEGICSGLLAVYTGVALDSLTEVASSAGGCPSGASFDAEADTTYWLALDGPGGATSSGQISIRDFSPPSNDDFAAAEALTGGLPITVDGTMVDATHEANEPSHGFGGHGSVWYSWQPASSGTVVIETSECDTAVGIPVLHQVAVYTGAELATLTPVKSGSGCVARVRFAASAGTIYRIAVDADSFWGPPTEGFELTLRELSPPANDDFANAAALDEPLPLSESGSNLDATSETNEPSHAGGPGPGPGPGPGGERATVWYSWTAPANGPMVLELSGCAPSGGPQNVVVYEGATLSTLSSVASTTGCNGRADFAANSGVTYRIAVDGPLGTGEGDFALDLREFDPPANDDFVDALELDAALPVSVDADNIDAGKEAGEPNHAGGFGAASVWFSWTPTADVSAKVGLDYCGDDSFPPLLAVYTGSDLGSLTEVASNGMIACNERLAFEASADTTYWIAVDGHTFLGDGQGEFELSIVDGDGGDTTPPDTSIDSGPANGSTTSDSTPTFTFSGTPPEDVDHFECKLDESPFFSCTTPQTTPELTDGEHTVSVRAVDAAGNADPTPASRNFTVDTGSEDTTPPDTTIDSGPAQGSTTDDSTPTFTFSGTPGDVDHFECRVDAGSFAGCDSPKTLAELADGEHTFEVRAVDAAGNEDATPATRTFTVDTTAPDVTIDQGPAEESTIADATPEFEFSSTAEDVDRFECKVDEGGFSACTSPKTLAELADGGHSFSVKAIDAVGNSSAAATRTFTVDTAGPTLTIDSGPSGPTKITDPEFGFTAEAGSTLACSIDDGTTAFGDCETETTHGPASPLADGSYTFRVRATDDVGNVTTKTREFKVDTVAPTSSIVSGPGEGSTSKKTNPSFALGSSEANSSFECSLDGESFTACNSPKTFSGLSEAAHTFAVRATDPAGNQGAPSPTRSWTIDSATTTETTNGSAPAGGTVSSNPEGGQPTPEEPVATGVKTPTGGEVTIVTSETTTTTPPEGGFEIFGQEIEITAPAATVEEPLELSFVLDASLIPDGTDISLVTVYRNGSPAADCDGSGQAVPDPCISDRVLIGDGDLEITALSSHASIWNLGTAPDTTPPDTAIDSGPGQGSTIKNPTPTFTFSGSPASDVDHFECRTDGGAFTNCSSPRTLTSLSDGEHTFRVRAVDAAGNADGSPATRTFTVDTSTPSDPPADEPPADDPPADDPPADDPPVEKPPTPPDEGDEGDSADCEQAQADARKAKKAAKKAKAKKRKAKKAKKNAAKKARKADSKRADKKLKKAQKKLKKATKQAKKKQKKAKKAKQAKNEACDS